MECSEWFRCFVLFEPMFLDVLGIVECKSTTIFTGPEQMAKIKSTLQVDTYVNIVCGVVQKSE